MGDSPIWEFNPGIAALIRFKVRRLIEHPAFIPADAEDLQQELWLCVAHGMRTHDSGRSSARTYQQRIVVSKIPTIIEHATAKKRDRRRELNIQDAPETVLIDPSGSAERVDTRLDVNRAVGRLPAELRAIATLFMEFNESEVVRRTGYSREKVRGMRRRIAERFREMGLYPDSRQ
jgi:DNA-directed RNA polymerase specialized sigma24 family protein